MLEIKMSLQIADTVKFGVQGMCLPRDPAQTNWEPDLKNCSELLTILENYGFDSFWSGDHIAFVSPIVDPLTLIAWASAKAPSLEFGTAIYLLPLRHPVPVAKQIACLDQICEGKFTFGVGVGGEYEKEFEACGVNVSDRGARLTDSLHVIKKLWSGEKVSHSGISANFTDLELEPTPYKLKQPPIWAGGRSKAALKRAAKLCDGYISYVVTPEMFAKSIKMIEEFYLEENSEERSFDTAHHIFVRLDNEYEKSFDLASEQLSQRYGMDFSGPTKKYVALGPKENVTSFFSDFIDSGVRNFVIDFAGPENQRNEQAEIFGSEVLPLLREINI
tara:strand:- start:311 stop:1306 length:996 start_codon:yes stop_codon:yes gene_type:complete